MKHRIITSSILCIALFITSGFSTTKESIKHTDNYEYLKERLKNTKAYTVEVFQAMPDDKYGYKPIEDVRSFGALASHITYSIEWFIPKLKGSPIKWEPGDEDRFSKKELIIQANKQFDKLMVFLDTAKETPELTELIIDLLSHNAHHRGQMVTYLRMNGIVPPDYR